MKFFGLGMGVLMSLILGSASANAIEEPEYEVVELIGEVEIREYAPRIVAVTTLASNSDTTGGFRRLADYIFGGNSAGKSIAMTAPVEETLGVPEPLMAFTMPAEYTMAELPEPDNEAVTLREVDARTVAVTQFSGWATAGRVARAERELREALAQRDITVTGAATLNQYNPPWTLPFLRRNEVMVPVATR
ncbi:SOUL family heme-binding protein [Pseudohalioglobus sediminis]|nr:heme-binding protein [Pseudohalioglobus sediminis]